MTEADYDSHLDALRQRIDTLDEQLVALLNERADVAIEIGKHKRDRGGEGAAIYIPHRHEAVLDKVRALNDGPLPDTCVAAIWRELMSGSLALEGPFRVGYLGPPGSFSHLAARRKFGGVVTFEPCEGIADVFDAVSRGHVSLGLAPIENSTIGGISETLDGFVETSVKVCAEVLVSIHHNLLCKSEVGAIKRVCSKPEALRQCRNWLNANMREAELAPVASSSKAAEMAAADPTTAAVGSTLAGEIYGLPVQQANIEDYPNNVTRFFVIGAHPPNPSGDDKTAIMFTASHEPGALANILDTFRDHGLNLTHIDKRPSRRVNWEYFFFVDFLGHHGDPAVAAAIDAARMRCQQLTVLGSFPRAKEVL